MYAKIATRTIVAIAPIARRTVVDSFGTVGPLGAGAGGCSMGSALDDRLPALRAELHAAGTSWPSGHLSVWAAPHSGQNFCPGPTIFPHLMHGLLPAAIVVSAPQFPQNFVVTAFIVPHFGHRRCWVCCCWAIIPGIWDAIPYPMPMR